MRENVDNQLVPVVASMFHFLSPLPFLPACPPPISPADYKPISCALGRPSTFRPARSSSHFWIIKQLSEEILLLNFVLQRLSNGICMDVGISYILYLSYISHQSLALCSASSGTGSSIKKIAVDNGELFRFNCQPVHALTSSEMIDLRAFGSVEEGGRRKYCHKENNEQRKAAYCYKLLQ